MNSTVKPHSALKLRRVRAEALPKLKGGLRALYRTLEWTRSRPLARPSEGLLLRKIPFAGGLHRSRSVGLTAFAIGKSFSPFPKWLKSQTAQVPGANPLKDAHAALDTAVLITRDFTDHLTAEQILGNCPALNLERTAEEDKPAQIKTAKKTYAASGRMK